MSNWRGGRGGGSWHSWSSGGSGWGGGGSGQSSHGGGNNWGGDAAHSQELVPAPGGDGGDAARSQELVPYGGGGDSWSGDSARSQRKRKGKGRRPVQHMNPLPLAPQTTDTRMRLVESYLASGHTGLTPNQLILQIADGDFRGMAVWWDAPEPLQNAFRHVLESGMTEFEFEHEHAGGQTRYRISFDTMTSTNPDSGTERAIMW